MEQHTINLNNTCDRNSTCDLIIKSPKENQFLANKTARISRICRDYIRGQCRRKFCRYTHQIQADAVTFCHDFQNSVCDRINCKFLHYSFVEEEYFKKYGKFPSSSAHPSAIIDSSDVFCCKNLYRKRASIHFNTLKDNLEFTKVKNSPMQQILTVSVADLLTTIRRFDDEQQNLRRRLVAAEIRITELKAANDYLMQQRNVAVVTSSTQPTAAVVTNTTVQTAQPIVAIGTSSTTQGQQIALAQPATLATTAQSIGVTGAHPSQLLGRNQISLTPAIASSTSISSLSISNAAQPIISYPIMSHSILPH